MKCTDCIHKNVCEKRQFIEFADKSIDINVKSEDVCSDFISADKVFLVDTELLIREKINQSFELLLDAVNRIGEAIGTAFQEYIHNCENDNTKE